MAEITILIDGSPFHLDDEGLAALKALRCPRNFHGAEPENQYGDVPITIDGKVWKMRIGNREWWAAEEKFKVKGVPAVMAVINASEKALAEFYKIALSRHHADTDIKTIGELMDYKPADEDQPSLADVLERCLLFSRPKRFADDEPDPKGQAALMAALLAKAATTPKESTATT
jgi:hypothetical protein